MKRSYSYSEWSMAITCLRKYKLCVIDRLDIPHEVFSGDLAFGSAVHAALNAMLEGDDGLAVFELMWTLEKDKTLAFTRFDWAALAQMGMEFLRKFAKRMDRYELITAETRLYAEYKGVSLEGTPDFVGRFDGLVSVRDFKTSGYNYPEEKALVALQLNLYAYLAIKNGYGPIQTLGYDVFNKGTSGLQRPMTWEFSEKKMYELLDDMVAYIRTIERGTDFPRNPNACIQGASGSMVCKYYKTCWGG